MMMKTIWKNHAFIGIIALYWEYSSKKHCFSHIFPIFSDGFCHAQVCGSKSGLQKLSGAAEQSRLLAATLDFPIELKHIPFGYLT